ncbi:hypothetical protein PanWU01x14_160450 [Parasponia andersonii]|uniref:Uncharacterized protein n=1 Tax=Parasponia andersonii TaxID=3476 RepID=A0A2P5CE22_PARAD|nr:hypothetical protein PanWU01x14_160450 [Parasponia andersonii]
MLAAERGSLDTVLRWLSRLSFMNIGGMVFGYNGIVAAYCVFSAQFPSLLLHHSLLLLVAPPC